MFSITHVSLSDRAGGAERIAALLCEAALDLGMDSSLLVGFRRSQANYVHELRPPKYKTRVASWCNRFQEWSLRQSVPIAPRFFGCVRDFTHQRSVARRIKTGREDFDFPACRQVIGSVGRTADLFHCHNLHGGYFDLRVLPWLSRWWPVVLTLHDAWLLAGHCTHSFDCERWKTGCGSCPDLTIPPALEVDGTAYNWRRKRGIFRRSRLYVATPCQWLMDKVNQSVLAAGVVDSRVIPHGVDQEIFRVYDKTIARKQLGIESESQVLLFAANGIRNNPWKDFGCLRSALQILGKQPRDKRLIMLALGDEGPQQEIGSAILRFIPKRDDPEQVARYYQAADAYVHAARADTFPNTVLESLSCGTPVVATAVGGIPEQVRGLRASGPVEPSSDGWAEIDTATGILTPPADSRALANAIDLLIENTSIRARLAENAHRDAMGRFGLDRFVGDYLAWYSEILDSRRGVLSGR